MKRIVVVLFLVVLVASLAGCGAPVASSVSSVSSEVVSSSKESSSASEASSAVESNSSAVSASSVAENSSLDEELLKDISVTFRQDIENNGKIRMIVDIVNKSTKTFSGDIYVTFYGSSPETMDSDTIFVEDLDINEKTYANVFVTPSSTYEFKHKFSSYSFREDLVEAGGKLDEELSEALTTFMYGNFGGSGKPEFATSWYKNIKKLEVFNDTGSTYAVVTVDTKDEQNIKTIMMCVLRNFDDKTLDKVIVNDETGNKLNEYSQ